ncbi:MAG: ABC transporter permease [Coprococcus sp.]
MSMLIEQLKVEVRVYLRQPMYLLFSLLMPVISFVIFGMMYKDVDYNGMSFFANYIPGFSVIILFASSVYNIGNQVVGDKEKGIYRRLAVTPISLKRIMAVVVFKAFLLALLGFILILLLAAFLFKVEFPNLLIYSISYIVAIIYSLILGFSAGMLADKINTYSAVMMALFMPMFILSDTTIPLSVMPEIFGKIAKFNPLYHMTSVLRVAWDISIYKRSIKSFWQSMLFLIVLIIVFIVIVVYKWKKKKK